MKNVYENVLKKCPQDGGALRTLISRLYLNNQSYERDDIVHKNILLAGDYGIGKTTMVKEVSKALNIPFCEVSICNNELGESNIFSVFDEALDEIVCESDEDKVKGIVYIRSLEDLIYNNQLAVLPSFINKKYYFDDEVSEVGENIDISGITYIGEVNIDKLVLKNPVSVKVRRSFKLSHTKEQLVAVINKACEDFYSKMIYEYLNSKEAWDIFPEHIIMTSLSKEDVRNIVVNSSISDYMHLISQLSDDEFIMFSNGEVIDYVVDGVINSPIRLNAISPIFSDLLDKASKQKKLGLK